MSKYGSSRGQMMEDHGALNGWPELCSFTLAGMWWKIPETSSVPVTGCFTQLIVLSLWLLPLLPVSGIKLTKYLLQNRCFPKCSFKVKTPHNLFGQLGWNEKALYHLAMFVFKYCMAFGRGWLIIADIHLRTNSAREVYMKLYHARYTGLLELRIALLTGIAYHEDISQTNAIQVVAKRNATRLCFTTASKLLQQD